MKKHLGAALLFIRKLSFVLFIVLTSQFCFAQNTPPPSAPSSGDAKEGQGDFKNTSFEVSTGPFLPQNVSGFQEIVASVAFRFSTKLSTTLRQDITYLNGRDKGLQYQMLLWSAKKEFDVYGLMDTYWIMGLQWSRYQTATQAPLGLYNSTSGWHFGMGIYLGKNKNGMRFRHEYIWGMKPGRFLYVGFGVSFPLF